MNLTTRYLRYKSVLPVSSLCHRFAFLHLRNLKNWWWVDQNLTCSCGKNAQNIRVFGRAVHRYMPSDFGVCWRGSPRNKRAGWFFLRGAVLACPTEVRTGPSRSALCRVTWTTTIYRMLIRVSIILKCLRTARTQS